MSETNEPVAWIAPQAVLRLQRSSALGENVLTVDGGMTFDAHAGEFTVTCEEYEGDDGRCFDVEIDSSPHPGRDNLILSLPVSVMEKLIYVIIDMLNLSPMDRGAAEDLLLNVLRDPIR